MNTVNIINVFMHVQWLLFFMKYLGSACDISNVIFVVVIIIVVVVVVHVGNGVADGVEGQDDGREKIVAVEPVPPVAIRTSGLPFLPVF